MSLCRFSLIEDLHVKGFPRCTRKRNPMRRTSSGSSQGVVNTLSLPLHKVSSTTYAEVLRETQFGKQHLPCQVPARRDLSTEAESNKNTSQVQQKTNNVSKGLTKTEKNTPKKVSGVREALLESRGLRTLFSPIPELNLMRRVC